MKKKQLKKIFKKKYPAGFTTEIPTSCIKPGISLQTVKILSKKKNEPHFLLEWRLKAYNYWITLNKPCWEEINYKTINYKTIVCYSIPKKKITSIINPELKKTYEKLGISLQEQKRLAGIAIDVVFDSISIITTFKRKLENLGILFGSITNSIKKYPTLIKKYLGSVVTFTDNYYASLNSALFSDGSFCYIPKRTTCPVDLSTYFRINGILTGQFERTLLIVDDYSKVTYLEGCTAPIRNENQLHAAVVELITFHNAIINYSTVQNWYPGTKNGKGGIYNFVTKRGICFKNNSTITWTQLETGSSITWKYPSIILKGNNSVGAFYSIALTNNKQQADTGTKITHIGKNTKSTIIAKGVSYGKSVSTYRGLVQILKNAIESKNYSQCDSLILSKMSKSLTLPTIILNNNSSQIEHEATTSKISDDMLYYCKQRGLDTENSITLIVNGFCKQVLKKLPLEFALEAKKLLDMRLMENIVG